MESVLFCSIIELFGDKITGTAWRATARGLNPNVADLHVDSDGDGRTNLEEYNAGANPIIVDDWSRSIAEQDKSFICDTHVEYIGDNPTFDTTFAVIKVSNGFVCDTGELYYDWDCDGIPNWWEARFSRNGSKIGLDASTDDDADGMSNYGEFVAYTDRRDISLLVGSARALILRILRKSTTPQVGGVVV